MSVTAITVIAAVYNAEKTLRRCVDSILTQTFRDFELLLIDDCSTDSCPAICDEYAQKDSRVKIIHKTQNEGTAQARKTGIEAAQGEYIIFADHDDEAEREEFAEMYSKAKSGNYDMVICDFYEHTNCGQRVYWNQNPQGKDKWTLIKDVLLWEESFFSVTWNKLIKTEIYRNVMYYPRAIFSEDRAIMAQVLYYTGNIGYINKAFYHWFRRPSSASFGVKMRHIADDYESYAAVLQFFYKVPCPRIDELNNVVAQHITGFVNYFPNWKRIFAAYHDSLPALKQFFETGASEEKIQNEITFTKAIFLELWKKYFLPYLMQGYFYNIRMFAAHFCKRILPASLWLNLKTLKRKIHASNN